MIIETTGKQGNVYVDKVFRRGKGTQCLRTHQTLAKKRKETVNERGSHICTECGVSDPVRKEITILTIKISLI